MKIEIYGAEWCAFCKQAVSLCENKSLQYEYIDIDDTANLRALETRVGSKVRSVPQIFLDDVNVVDGYRGLVQMLS